MKREDYCRLSDSFGSITATYETSRSYLTIDSKERLNNIYIKVSPGDLRRIAQILVGFADELGK